MGVESITAELIAGGILLPIVWFLLRNNKKYIDRTVRTFEKGFENLIIEQRKFREENSILHHKLIKEISYAVGRTSLSRSQSVDMVREKMWYTSESKINYIKDILIKNNLSRRKPMITKNIKAELTRLSNIYVEELNNYNSELGNLGDLINDHFQTKEFFDELFYIVFRDKDNYSEATMEIELKLNDIRTIMKNHQNNLISKLKTLQD